MGRVVAGLVSGEGFGKAARGAVYRAAVVSEHLQTRSEGGGIGGEDGELSRPAGGGFADRGVDREGFNLRFGGELGEQRREGRAGDKEDTSASGDGGMAMGGEASEVSFARGKLIGDGVKEQLVEEVEDGDTELCFPEQGIEGGDERRDGVKADERGVIE